MGGILWEPLSFPLFLSYLVSHSLTRQAGTDPGVLSGLVDDFVSTPEIEQLCYVALPDLPGLKGKF